MPAPYYPTITITPNLGLALVGIEQSVAENFVLIDAAIVNPGNVKVNSVPIAFPNFNNLFPTPPLGSFNVVFQTDGTGNVSAYLTGGWGGTPGGNNTEIQFNN